MRSVISSREPRGALTSFAHFSSTPQLALSGSDKTVRQPAYFSAATSSDVSGTPLGKYSFTSRI
jgi:hypothetical protein